MQRSADVAALQTLGISPECLSDLVETAEGVPRLVSFNRLLIVDDEPEVARFMAKVAESCGYEAAVALRAEEFYERYRAWQPTHIMLDLQMPGAGGAILLKFLAAEKCRAPVMLMSGLDTSELDEQRRLSEADGLTMAQPIKKPMRLAELRALLTGLKRAERG